MAERMSDRPDEVAVHRKAGLEFVQTMVLNQQDFLINKVA
jgi:hypothetical protein